MKSKSGAWAAGLLALAVIGGGGLYWKFGRGEQQGGWAMAPAKVAVAPVQQADFPAALSGIATLEATRQVLVSAEADGRVARILFTPGERVRAGQLLVQLNDAPEQGELARLQAQARNARALLERTRRLLETPLSTLRQTDEGTSLIGDSQEEAGYVDNHVGLPILGTLADRAVRTLPALREVRVVRSWAALRVMSQDGFPIYQQSETCPGAFVATCHSGVTLAAAHAFKLAPMIAAGQLADDMAPFSTRRFHVQEAG